MGFAVSPKTARRQGVTKENEVRVSARLVLGKLTCRAWEAHALHGSSTEKQRSRRAVFGETLRAEALLPRFIVAPRSQIPADMLARRSANQVKISLSSMVHGFSTARWGFLAVLVKPREKAISQ